MTETAPAARGFFVSRGTITAIVAVLALVAAVVAALVLRYPGSESQMAAAEACAAAAEEPFEVDRVQTTEQMIDEVFAEESVEQRAAKVASLGLGGLLEEKGYALWVFGDLGHQKVVCLVPMTAADQPGPPQFIDASVLSQL